MSLVRQVALVTGVSRGIGKGIALYLSSSGATVYGTALKPEQEDDVIKSLAKYLPTLESTVEEAKKRGGNIIPIYCDHRDSNQINSLFEQIAKEQNNQLDIFVSNVYSAVTLMLQVKHKKFWELPENVYDEVLNVGLRDHYMCSRLAAKMMVSRKKGLIVQTSSPGGLGYVLNTAYGIAKAGNDKLAADMAIELRDFNVASVSLWSSAVRSELFDPKLGFLSKEMIPLFTPGNGTSSSVEYSGMCIAAMASDPKIMEKSGHILTEMELGKEYNLIDNDGAKPWCPITESYLEVVHGMNKIRKGITM